MYISIKIFLAFIQIHQKGLNFINSADMSKKWAPIDVVSRTSITSLFFSHFLVID